MTTASNTTNTQDTNIYLTSVEVMYHEGRLEDDFTGHHASIEAFNAAVLATATWADNSGMKIGITLHFSDGSTHGLRYDVENYNGNGTVDLYTRIMGWVEYVGTERWEQLQTALKVSEEDRAETVQRAADLPVWLNNEAPVEEAEEQTTEATTATVSTSTLSTPVAITYTTTTDAQSAQQPTAEQVYNLTTLWGFSTTYTA